MLNSALGTSGRRSVSVEDKDLNAQYLVELLSKLWRRKRLPALSIIPHATLRTNKGAVFSLDQSIFSSKERQYEALTNTIELLQALQEFLLGFNRCMVEVDIFKPKTDFLPSFIEEIIRLIADIIAIECTYVTYEIDNYNSSEWDHSRKIGDSTPSSLAVHHLIFHVATLLLDRIGKIILAGDSLIA
jgi:hypothetical protein